MSGGVKVLLSVEVMLLSVVEASSRRKVFAPPYLVTQGTKVWATVLGPSDVLASVLPVEMIEIEIFPVAFLIAGKMLPEAIV